MKDDEILLELVNSLKEQNEDLKKQLKERPRSVLGIAEMWISFWGILGGVWKDFWTAIASMWKAVWDDRENVAAVTIGSSIVLVIAIIAGSIVGYHAWVPDEPRPKPIGKYHMTAYGDCFYVAQEMSDGSSDRSSPCIEDKKEALQLLKELRLGTEDVRPR